MERLAAIPGSATWTLVSIEGLHRFYRGRTEDVVASWMTREDREVAIADNLAYVAAALEEVPHDQATRIVYAGFSQGVAMAFRAGLLGRDARSGISRSAAMCRRSCSAIARDNFHRCCSARAGSATNGSRRPNSIADVAALTARGRCDRRLRRRSRMERRRRRRPDDFLKRLR